MLSTGCLHVSVVKFNTFVIHFKFNNMARLTLGSGITSLNGSIGGTTYQSSNAGTIAKNKGFRTQKSSYQSDKAKYTASLIAQTWSSLGASDKLAWNNFSIYKPTAQKHNSGRFLNGQQIFTKYNYARYAYDGTIVSSPVFTTAPAINRTIILNNTGTALLVRVDTAIDETSEILIFAISGQIKQGRARAVGGIKSVICTFGNTTDVDITAKYTALYGAIPPVGAFIEIRWQLFNVANTNFSNVSNLVVEVV